MTPEAQPPRPATAYWPLVIISDIHFGKHSSAADMLYEFLERTRCDTLILNGDIIDGWHLTARHHRKFPEMQKRVMDLLNARIAAGTRVIYIPGNHDNRLRKRGLFGKNVL
jgi:UDP-2,3-diacylglucosamine pyrophosphatase LpxH